MYPYLNTSCRNNRNHLLVNHLVLAVLNGANAAALQTRAGLVEIFQFQTATALGGGLYRLGGLLRARRGSDFAMGTHAAGDMFVLLATDTISRVPTDSGEIGAERIYRATSFGTFSDASRRHAFTDSGASLKPLSAVHVKGARDGSSNLTITWIRRTRIGQRWIDFSDVPLGEDSEAYEVDIYNAGWTAVLRTIAVTAQTASYTAAQQTTDFGAPQAAINIKVYQISAAVGRGFAATATV